jgi:hypothetical protein
MLAWLFDTKSREVELEELVELQKRQLELAYHTIRCLEAQRPDLMIKLEPSRN